MPAPPEQPTDFLSILEQVWWRLDAALDLEMLRWSAMLGAVEALQCGTTAIVDHHESPNAIEGSLSVIADACAEVGVRVVCAYGVTDRHGADGARRGLAENERFLRAGGRGMVGVHAAFTCSDDTLAAAAGLAARPRCRRAHPRRRGPRRRDRRRAARSRWPPTTGCSCTACTSTATCPGTIAHNPRSNMNNAVGYARPAAPPEPGRARHRRHRRRHARGVPPRLRRPPGRRRLGLARHGVELARARATRSCPRRATTGDVELRPRRLAVARGVHPRGAGARRDPCRRRGAAARRRARPASTSTRSGPRPPSRPPASSPASDSDAVRRVHGRSVTAGPCFTERYKRSSLPGHESPCPVRSTSRTPTRSARAWRSCSTPRQRGFDAVWQADSRLVRDAVVPMAAFAAVTERIKIGSRCRRLLDPQPGPPGVARSRRSTTSRPGGSSSASARGGIRWPTRSASPGPPADGDARGRHRGARPARTTRP